MKKILKMLLTVLLIMPITVRAWEQCNSYTLNQITTGSQPVVCVNALGGATGIGGDDSNHRFVKNPYSSSYDSILVVNTAVYMGDGDIKAAMPAYCVNEKLHGVGDKGVDDPKNYAVTLKDWSEFVAVEGNDKATKVRNIILNGYIAKSASELGFTYSNEYENNYDAFTATKLAVFTVLNHYGYSLSNEGLTYYEPVTASHLKNNSDYNADRANAIVQKVKDLVKYSSNTAAVDQEVTFTEGEVTNDGSVVSKTFTVNPPMGGKLNVSLQNAPTGTKIDGEEVNSKDYTNAEYYGTPITVTVTVPVSSIPKEGMNIGVSMNYSHTKYELFYGVSGNSSLQNYIITKPVFANDNKVFNMNADKARTCDDVKKEYGDCKSCEKVLRDYVACDKKGNCDDKIKQQYEACKGNFVCKDDLKKEYEECVDRTCDDVKDDYATCTTCEKVAKTYEKCNKDNSCSEEIKSQYEACDGNYSCKDDLKKEYEACVSRTCDDVKKDYENCNTCKEVKDEYDKCSKDNSCSAEVIKKYEECNGNFTCSDDLQKEYEACYPTIDEVNPDTMGLNILLVTLIIVGGSYAGIVSYKKRKELGSQI